MWGRCLMIYIRLLIARVYTSSHDSAFSLLSSDTLSIALLLHMHFAFQRPPIYFSCPFSTWYIGLTTLLYTFPLIFTFIFLSNNTPDVSTLFQFLLCRKARSVLLLVLSCVKLFTLIDSCHSCRIGKMPGKLKVKIVAAQDLPVMDRASELTDAFVEVTLNWFCHVMFV